MKLFFIFTVILFLGERVFTKKNLTKHRSVNLALETIIEFDNQNKKQDAKFLDDVQTFLSKIKNAIFVDDDKSSLNKVITTSYRPHYFKRFYQNYRRNEDPHMKFTDFLENTIIILKTFSNSDLEKVFRIMKDALKTVQDTDTEIELIDSRNVRRFIGKKMTNLKHISAKVIRKHLGIFLRKLQDRDFEERDLSMMKFLNSLYDDDSTEDFILFLSSLESYKSATKRSSRNLAKVIKKGLSSIILDHYKNLDPEQKGALRVKLETYWFDIVPTTENSKTPEALSIHVNHEKYKLLKKKRAYHKTTKASASESNEKLSEPITIAKKHKSRLDVKERERKAKRVHFEYEHQKPLMTLYVEPTKKVRKPHSTRKMKMKRIVKYTTAKSIEVDFRHKKDTQKTAPPAITKIFEHNAVIEVDKDPVKGTVQVLPPSSSSSSSEGEKNVIENKVEKSRNEIGKKNTTGVVAEFRIHSSSGEANTIKVTQHFDIDLMKRRDNLEKTAKHDYNDGLSIESFEQSVRTYSARKSNFNDTLIDNNTKLMAESVYSRIRELEQELADVKNKMRNAQQVLVPAAFERHSLSVNNPTPAPSPITIKASSAVTTTTKATTASVVTIPTVKSSIVSLAIETTTEEPEVTVNTTKDSDKLQYWQGTSKSPKAVTSKILIWRNVSKDYVNSITNKPAERVDTTTPPINNVSISGKNEVPVFRVSYTDKDEPNKIPTKQHFKSIPVDVPITLRDFRKPDLKVSKPVNVNTTRANPIVDSNTTVTPTVSLKENTILKETRRDLQVSLNGVKDLHDAYEDDIETDR